MAIHPKGDNLLVSTYDKKILWFDLDLSTKPYQTIRLHRNAVRSSAYHLRYPLFASASDDLTVIVSHGMVYKWERTFELCVACYWFGFLFRIVICYKIHWLCRWRNCNHISRTTILAFSMWCGIQHSRGSFRPVPIQRFDFIRKENQILLNGRMDFIINYYRGTYKFIYIFFNLTHCKYSANNREENQCKENDQCYAN